MENNYPTNSPEWQLREIEISSLRLSESYSLDADRLLKKASEAAEKSEKYRIALETLKKGTL